MLHIEELEPRCLLDAAAVVQQTVADAAVLANQVAQPVAPPVTGQGGGSLPPGDTGFPPSQPVIAITVPGTAPETAGAIQATLTPEQLANAVAAILAAPTVPVPPKP